MTVGLPIGTVTFLLVDSELVGERIIERAVAAHGGVSPDWGAVDWPSQLDQENANVAMFNRASDALAAASQIQEQVHATRDQPGAPAAEKLGVRISIHTGESESTAERGVVAAPLLRANRLLKLGHPGQTLVSSASRDLAIDQLGDAFAFIDLGEHRLADLARPEHVYQLVGGNPHTVFPPLRSIDTIPNNLPVRLSTFIGRHDELVMVAELVRKYRLVTVTGSGGAGKTRLALQASGDLISQFPEGVWWVELAPLTDPEGVMAEVAMAVAANLVVGKNDAEVIAKRLGNQKVLLVLDNCEHVQPTSAELADVLLRKCPNVHILATSRVPLNVPGEHAWRVPPLSLPERGVAIAVDRLSQFDAIQLFVSRATIARPSFGVSDENGSQIAEVCHRLDGIPLAIELAAARTKALLPHQILEGLSDALRLLGGGSQLVLPRQQTLEASIRWSCALLGELERHLLFRMAVFRGSFDLAAIERVCSGEGVEPTDVLGGLECLIDHSLVVPAGGESSGRFTMFETLRQFGLRQLERDGGASTWRAKHARYFALIAKDLGPRCETSEQFAAIRALELERDNMRVALAWCRDMDDPAGFTEMVSDLGRFWSMGGDRAEGVLWSTRALELLPPEPSLVHARILADRAEWVLTLGNPKSALEDCLAAVKMGRAVGDQRAEGRANATLMTLLAFGAFPLWKRQWEKTFEMLQRGDDSWALTNAKIWGAVPLLIMGRTAEGLVVLNAIRSDVLATRQPMLIATQWLWEAFAANQAGQPAEAEVLIHRALTDNALGSFHRTSAAHTILDVSRGWRGLRRVELDHHRGGLAKARRDGEVLAAEFFSLLGAVEVLRKDPHEARRRIDGWLANAANDSTMTRSPGVLLGSHAAFLADDLDDAHFRARRLVEWADERGEVFYRNRALLVVAAVHLHRSETIQAEVAVRESISGLVLHGNHIALCEAFELLGVVAAMCHDSIEAARLFGAGSALRLVMETPLAVPFDSLITSGCDLARSFLGADSFDAAFEAGSTLSIEEVVAFIDRTRGNRGRPSIGWNSLTPTELQVAELIREGLTNKEIAHRLLMGTETVKTHLSHIFSKLDISKRSQLAALTSERMRAEGRLK